MIQLPQQVDVGVLGVTSVIGQQMVALLDTTRGLS